MGKSKIKVSDLNLKYSNQQIVFQNASVELSDGLWLLDGENGSGKSTLLEIVSGRFDAGKRRAVMEYKELQLESSVILLDESVRVPFDMKEREVYNMVMKMNDLEADPSYPVCYEDRSLAHYSIGEQKFAVLRILSALSPGLILIDEYLTNLDRQHLERSIQLLEEVEKRGTLIIVASNDVYLKGKLKSAVMIQNKEICKIVFHTWNL